jgi:hypothetical protein
MKNRDKILEELLSASRQMFVDGSYPVTEDELVKYHSSSFEFGFACGALWMRKTIADEIDMDKMICKFDSHPIMLRTNDELDAYRKGIEDTLKTIKGE